MLLIPIAEQEPLVSENFPTFYIFCIPPYSQLVYVKNTKVQRDKNHSKKVLETTNATSQLLTLDMYGVKIFRGRYIDIF